MELHLDNQNLNFLPNPTLYQIGSPNGIPLMNHEFLCRPSGYSGFADIQIDYYDDGVVPE